MALDYPVRPRVGTSTGALARAAHAPPTIAVTLVTALLCVAAGLGSATTAWVVAAVATGQLSIGWSNDLIDLSRDRSVGRRDKPLVVGLVSPRAVAVACALALLASITLSTLLGWRAAVAQLTMVGGGWSYNLWLKRTAWSWAAYAVAFGALATVPTLAVVAAPAPDTSVSAPVLAWWLPLAGALLGVGAHLLNVLPDLGSDRDTGVSGLPHRIADRYGAARVTQLAVLLLLAATVLLMGVVPPSPVVVAGGLVVAGLATAVLLGRGRTPFLAAMAIALVDVALLAVAV